MISTLRTNPRRSFLQIHSETINLIIGILLLTGLLTLNFGCASPQGTADVKKQSTFSFWPLYPDEPRVQYLTSLRNLEDVNRQKRNAFEDIVYGQDKNSNPSLVGKPYGVTMHEGKIYVCDIKGQIAVMDLVKHQTRIMGISGSNPVQRPVDITIADDGMIYVADAGRGVIMVFDQDERSTAVFGIPGMAPIGVAAYQDELFVVDKIGSNIRVLDRFSGNEKRTFGQEGENEAVLGSPLGIDIDDEGNVFVTDVIQCRVRKFSNEGEFISLFGETNDTLGCFVRPKHVQVDSDGYIYVVDSGYANVQIFNQDYELLMFFGAGGNHPGAMFLPVGINVYEGDMGFIQEYLHEAFKPSKLIIVTNQFGPDKTSIYALGELREGYTAKDLAQTSVAISGTTDQGGKQIGQIGLTDDSVAPSDDVEDETPSGDGGS